MSRILLLALLGAAAPACSCGDDDGDGHPTRVEAVIGPSGGELISGDTLVWLVIPANAVAEELTFFIEESAAPTPDGALGIPYEIGVVGQNEATLAEPATITFYYDPAVLAGRSRSGLHGATWAAGAADWICITFSAASPVEDAIELSTTHLSTWVPRFVPCTGDDPCPEPEKCVVTGASEGFCAIPCLQDSECPAPMSCTEDHVCSYSKCYGTAVQCPDGTECSMPGESPGVCLEPCDAGACVDLASPQHECTAAGHCVISVECSATDPICDADTEECMDGWCVSRYSGCDCSDPACPCIGNGGQSADLSGTWYHRYNCASRPDGTCFDEDSCADTTLAPGAQPGEWVGDDDDFVGTLVDDVLHWEMHVSGDAPYTELGTWTFSADFQTFTQQSCYAYDADGTVDRETWTCAGLTAGDCTASGSRDSAGPPAAIGRCPEGSDQQSCP